MFRNKMIIENKPGCVKFAASVLGDKWTPLLLQALSKRPFRFCELQKEVGGINPRTLSARLLALEQHQITVKSAQHSSSAYAQYSLTQKGIDLMPVLQSMADWGSKYCKQ
jgi:DNA-binding HxlR family transcriptional regulator